MTTRTAWTLVRQLPYRRSCIQLLVGLVASVCCLGSPAAMAADYPTPRPPLDDSQFGAHVQRTMTLLATSTPQQRKKVKILFYGQSITGQKWWRDIAADLRQRFPHADLEITNRAIGGFGADLLLRTAEHDLYPYYPDLMIFHVYGGHRPYEQLIRTIRRRTTTEIAIYTDHVTANTKTDDDGRFIDGQGVAFMANWLVDNARNYDCECIDVRPDWKRYLRANNLQAADILRDNVHLNDQGCFLLAELVKRHLVYKPQFPADPNGMVTTYIVGQDVTWKDGKLTLDFAGNRVDVLAAVTAAPAASAEVLVDGKRPSEFPQAYAITRASAIHNVWPAVIHVSSVKPLILEDWTCRIVESDEVGSKFTFEVVGSRTGPDGFGTSTEKFVSNSGRVVIEPRDWHLERTCKYVKKPVPKNFETKWRVLPMFVDRYVPPKVEDPTREYATTLIQGIANTAHKLEIAAASGQSVPIHGIRVYKPPLD